MRLQLAYIHSFRCPKSDPLECASLSLKSERQGLHFMASAVVHGTGMGRRGYECFESDSLAVFTLSSPGSEEFLECFQFSRLDILGSARSGGDRMESVHFLGAPCTTSGFYGRKGRVSVSYHPINVQKYRVGRGFENTSTNS